MGEGRQTEDEKSIENQEDFDEFQQYKINNETNNKINNETTALDKLQTNENEDFYIPKWIENIESNISEALTKTVTWKRYEHPTRPGIKTTIRQMIMDIVCINRLRRYLFPEEERVAIQIQKDLNEGKLTYDRFKDIYRQWERANVPRISYLAAALYSENRNEIRINNVSTFYGFQIYLNERNIKYDIEIIKNANEKVFVFKGDNIKKHYLEYENKQRKLG